MIARLNGVVVEIDGERIIIDVQGVGYEVVCSRALATRCEAGASITCTVFTDVREDSIRLFGFDSRAEKEVFLLLNRVSGMGPRSSMDVVSNVAVRDLLRAIGSGDVQSLMRIKGVGKKKAERIVVELRDLVGAMAGERATSLREMVSVERSGGVSDMLPSEGYERDAIAALEVLGFPRKDAEAAVSRAQGVAGSPKDVGELVREALRHV
jgi:Holliday junction DNA helicase RuvA